MAEHHWPCKCSPSPQTCFCPSAHNGTTQPNAAGFPAALVTRLIGWRIVGELNALPADAPKQYATALEKFEANTVRTPDSCWYWTGQTRDGRYGLFRFRTDGYQVAHRWSYEHFVGPIPDGLTLDHLCRVTMCVNPDHLEPVTLQENILRSDNPPAQNARKTHCIHGHEFTPENTKVAKDGHRACRACSNARNRVRRSARVVCPDCGEDLALVFMARHRRSFHKEGATP